MEVPANERSSSRGEISRTALLELPVELVEWIAWYMTIPDLLATRLTCRDLDAKTSFVVATRCFTDRAFLINNALSMETLCRISLHAKYGKSMKRVVFDTARLQDSMEDYRMRQHGADRVQDRGTRAVKRAYRQAHEHHVEQERIFREQGGLDTALLLIFAGFRLARNAPKFVLGGSLLHKSPAPWGLTQLRKSLGYDDCLTFRPDDSVPFESLWFATAETELPITRLELGNMKAPVPFQVFREYNTSNCFRHLQSLRIVLPRSEFTPDETDDENSVRIEQDMLGFLSLVSEAVYLRTLAVRVEPERIGHTSYTDPWVFSTLLKGHLKGMQEPLQHIRSLEVCGLTISLKDLTSFVEKHRATLQELCLRDVKDGEIVDKEVGQKLRAVSGKEDFKVLTRRAYVGRW